MNIEKLLKSAYFLILPLSIGLVFLAIWHHPFMGDDWSFLWKYEKSKGYFSFVYSNYMNWSGRVLQSTFPGIFFSSENMVLLSKILTIPCFLVMTGCCYYLATGSVFLKNKTDDYVLFSSLVWLGLPVVGTTVVWLTGSVYLWTSTASLIFLCFFYKMKLDILSDADICLSPFVTILLMLFALIVGTAGIQFIFTIITIFSMWLWQIVNINKLKNIPFSLWLILISFLFGICVFFLSPGNFVRLEYVAEISFLSNLSRFVMFILGAYFNAGVGNLGVSLWLGILIILLISPMKENFWKLKEPFIWMLASLLSFIPFFPLINFAAPRVTFFPILLLFIGIKSLTDSNKFIKGIIFNRVTLIIILSLVGIDGFVGFAANKSLSNESIKRTQIINKAVLEGEEEITIPYFETIPSRLTFLLTPQQDQEYLDNISHQFGVKSIIHDGSINAPKPNSKHSLKELKKNL